MSKATRKCVQCQKSFIRYLSRRNLEAGRGQFCGRTCNLLYRKTLPPEKQAHWQGGKPLWACLGCQKAFTSYKRGGGRSRLYCSKKCVGGANGALRRGKSLSIRTRVKLGNAFRGDRSHFWRGGVTRSNQLVRESVEYKLWREAVLRRDGFACVWCGNQANLQADHIKQFAFFPELRFAIDNGRTLCAPCHRKTPTWGNNGLNKKHANT